MGIDGIRFSGEMAHAHYRQLCAGLHRLGLRYREHQDVGVEIVEAIANAWGMIDNLWRLVQVIQHTPGFKRTPELRAHIRSLRSVEPFRNAFQHLHGELRRIATTDVPLLGTLTWFWTPEDMKDTGLAMVLIAGSLRGGGKWSASAARPNGECSIRKPTLYAFDKSLDLEVSVQCLRQLACILDQACRAMTAGATGEGSNLLISVELKYPSVP